MKTIVFYILICSIFSISLTAQQNVVFRGRILYMNSNKAPAVGVEVSGYVEGVGNANNVYTAYDGSYALIFPKAVAGELVNLRIGDTDGKGEIIELVNEEELREFRIPAIVTDEFEVIVCKKGYRDFIAGKYYKILKRSAKIEIDKLRKRLDSLLSQQLKDYDIISQLGDKIITLQRRADSVTIYREAFRLASINRDNAPKRVLEYLKRLDEGKSVLEARTALSIESAVNDMETGILGFNAGVEELETRAGASKSIFDYNDAIRCYDIIIKYLEKMEINPAKRASYYLKIAGVFSDDGNYKSALNYQEKAIGIQEEFLDPEHHPSLAISYNNIALTYSTLIQYEEALKYQQKTIDIWEKTLDPRHPDLATAYGNTGATYQALRQYKKALAYFQKAIDIWEEILDPKHPNLATIYNNIASVYQALGRYDRALSYYQKAITILEEALSPKHLDLATAYSNIASTYKALGQYGKALEYYQKAIGIQEEILDPKHASLGINYTNIAVTYGEMKDFQKAIAFQEKCLAIFKEALSENHPYHKIALNTMASIYNAKGLDYYRNKDYLQAIETYEKKLLKIAPEVKTRFFYNNIGLAYAKNKQFKEAFNAFSEYEKLFPNKGRTFRNWAVYYALQDNKKKALNNLKKALGLGYDDLEWLKTDDSMYNLRGEAAFIKIIEKLEKSEKNK